MTEERFNWALGVWVIVTALMFVAGLIVMLYGILGYEWRWFVTGAGLLLVTAVMGFTGGLITVWWARANPPVDEDQ